MKPYRVAVSIGIPLPTMKELDSIKPEVKRSKKIRYFLQLGINTYLQKDTEVNFNL